MKNIKWFISRKEIIKRFAKEVAYLHISADYWYYIQESQDMSDMILEREFEIKDFAHILGIQKKVYEEAYKIYDFRNSGKKGFVPNKCYIKTMYTKIVDPRKKKGLVF